MSQTGLASGRALPNNTKNNPCNKYHSNTMKGENYMMSTDAEKALDKIQHPLVIKRGKFPFC